MTIGVSNGVLSLGGAEVLSAQSYTSVPLEGSISFSAPWQHFGLATNLDTLAGNYYAIFSTFSRSDTLYARLNNNGSTTDVNLGPLPVGFHTYKIQPTSSGFEFSVDGVLQTTIAATFQNSQPMKAALSDFTSSSGHLLQADWVWFNNYSTSRTGVFTSTVFDAGQTVDWQSVNWTASVPTGTSLKIEISVTDDPNNWGAWVDTSNGAALTNTRGRYIRYRVTMTTSDGTVTPVLYDINLTWS
jgi:hypothetical protein